VKKIFLKLRVAWRAQAVSRPQALGILRSNSELGFFSQTFIHHGDSTLMTQ
jgi:hypothetical protein